MLIALFTAAFRRGHGPRMVEGGGVALRLEDGLIVVSMGMNRFAAAAID